MNKIREEEEQSKQSANRVMTDFLQNNSTISNIPNKQNKSTVSKNEIETENE